MAETTEHPAYKVARDFINLLTLAFCFYTANVGSRNQEKIERVEQKQTEVVVKQDVAAKNAEEVKQALDGRYEDDIKSQGVQLYSTWRYLEDMAVSTGHKQDKDKAIEARRLYDAHIKKYGTNSKG